MTYDKKSNVGHQANFTNCMAPDSVQGAGLKGVDQAAMQARQRLDAPRENSNNPFESGEWERREKDYQAVEHMERRKRRGGQTFSKHDTMGC